MDSEEFKNPEPLIRDSSSPEGNIFTTMFSLVNLRFRAVIGLGDDGMLGTLSVRLILTEMSSEGRLLLDKPASLLIRQKISYASHHKNFAPIMISTYNYGMITEY
jgi:hypothetical protein